MEIVHFPHPTLRHPSRPLKKVDRELKNMIAEMFELMYEARGIGLAANQVDLPFQVFVVNLAAEPGEGEEQVFINPVLSRPKGSEEAEEGCLSLPGVYGQVMRPKQIRVQAYNLKGEAIDMEVDGMLARVIQHENDHLQGTLFTDRLSEGGRIDVAPALDEFRLNFESKRRTGGIPSDEEILARLQRLEDEYCVAPAKSK